MKRTVAALVLLSACASEPRKDFVDLSYEAADKLYREARRELSSDTTIIYGVFTPAGQPSASLCNDNFDGRWATISVAGHCL